MRNALITSAVLAAAVVLVPRVATAQHCPIPEVPDVGSEPADGDHAHHAHHHHHDAQAHVAPSWWLVGTTSAIAGATTFMDESRDYEGLRVALQGGTRRVNARLAVPAYRLSSSGVGLGDTSLSVSSDVVPGRGRLRGGIGASIALPTGSGDHGLGMGHWMAATGPWLSLRGDRFDAVVAVSFASALGDNSEHVLHQHVADGWPLVDPMNPRELMTVARATAALVPGHLSAGAQLTFATPITYDGQQRLVAAVLAERTMGRYGVQFLVEAPIVGDPFIARALFELSYRFPT